jgi:hypothetical protein
MGVETVWENDLAVVWYHPVEKVVHHKIKKWLGAEGFKTMLTIGADCFEKNRCKKWLSDDRANAVVPPGIAEWGQQVWTPRVIKAGFKWWAVLMPDKAAGRLSMRGFIDTYRGLGVTVDIFADETSALDWLNGLK